MPKIKPTDLEAKRRIVRSCIARGMEAEAVTPIALANKARFSKETFYNRRKRPELYTLQNIRSISLRNIQAEHRNSLRELEVYQLSASFSLFSIH